MKKIYSILAGLLLTASVFAQAPQKMSYQAVIRNNSNTLLTSTLVGMKISILQGSASGTAVYVETQTPSTNTNGLVSIEIGAGTIVSGSFANIDWANGIYFVKTETDPTGGTSYTITGTSQLLSVPYALHAKTVDIEVDGSVTNEIELPTTANTGDMSYWNGTAWVTVAAGGAGQILYFLNNKPQWGPIVGPTDVINPSTGKVWMDRNLGASQVATSSTDAASYGDLYQWGRLTDGHQIRTSGTTATLSSTDSPGHGDFILAPSSPYDWRSPQNANLWQGVSGTNNPCPSGYRVPTEAELNAERTSWSSNNPDGAFASPLKLPVAGGRNISGGSLFNVGSSGFYWSSTVGGTFSRGLSFYSSGAVMYTAYRAYGLSMRCIKN